MIKSKYEIKIIHKSTLFFVKKFSTKTQAIRGYECIPKLYRKKTYPEIQLNQTNFNEEGDEISNFVIKKNRVNIEKINIENIKNIL